MNAIHIIFGLLILIDLIIIWMLVYFGAKLLLSLPLQKTIEEELEEKRKSHEGTDRV